MLNIPADFSFTNSRNAEHVLLHTNLLAEVPEEVAEVQGFLTPRNNYAAAVGRETNCFQVNTSFTQTEKMLTTDRVRDNGFYFIANIVDVYVSFCLDEEQMEAAKRLARVIKPSRGAASKPYGEETAILNDLYDKLQEESCAADVELLHLTPALTKAKEANDLYNTLYVERTREMNMLNTSASMKQLRPQTDEAFRQLALAINSYYTVNALSTKNPETETALSTMINNINGLLYQHDRTVRTRLGLSTKGKDNTPTPEPEPEPEPVQPKITAFYQKEGGDPERPLNFARNQTAVVEGTGLKLVDSPKGKKAALVLISYVDQRMPHEDDALLVNTDTRVEFTMMYDAAEGQYQFQIETYSNGTEEATIIKYPESITLT